MSLKTKYAHAMEWLYLACICVSAATLVSITVAIPYGVFMRYVMGASASWPEPFSVLMMVMFTFIGGAAAYRANVHIAVEMLTSAVPLIARKVLLRVADVCMIATSLFMMFYGAALVKVTLGQTIGEFPLLSVGITYLPVPLGGFFTLLFIIEKLWMGEPPASSFMFRDQPLTE